MAGAQEFPRSQRILAAEQLHLSRHFLPLFFLLLSVRAQIFSALSFSCMLNASSTDAVHMPCIVLLALAEILSAPLAALLR